MSQPTLSARINSLSPEKRELLLKLRAQKQKQEKSGPFSLISEEDRKKLPEGVVDAYPLSGIQMGMLFQMERDVDSVAPPSYHNLSTFKLQMPYEPEIFQRAVDAVVERHPIMRTGFDLTTYSEPMQLVYEKAHLKVDLEDLRMLPPAESDRRVKAFIQEENRRVIDTSKAPMIRLYVHWIEEELIWLSLTEPHSIADGWSTHLTLVEFFENHLALLKGDPIPEPDPLDLTYRDFIALERKTVASPKIKNFWKKTLERCVPTRLPRLPAIFHAESAGEKDHTHYFRPPTEVMDKLHNLAQKIGVPFKSVMLACHLKSLSLICGQDQVTTGLVFNGRPEALGGEKVRGLFLNTLPFPYQIQPGSWIDFIRDVYQHESEMIPFRRYPLSLLQQTQRESLFDAVFSYHHFHSVSEFREKSGIKDLDGVDLSTTDFDLMCAFQSDPNDRRNLLLIMDGNLSELAWEQFRAFYGYYERVFIEMSENPEGLHHHASFIPANERSLLLDKWVETTPISAQKCLHQLFEEQVQRNPNAIALTHQGEDMDYQTLNMHANRLAHRLMSMGVGPDFPVAVFMEHSPALIVSLLAILKAGGAYLPIDSGYPQERISYIMADSGFKILLSQSSLRERLPEMEATTLCLDEVQEDLARENNTNPVCRARPSNLVYLIYTSGSTGRPKGSLLSHHSVLRHLKVAREHFDFSPDDVWVLFHSVAFDISVWEIWGALLFGSRLTLPTFMQTRVPEDFHRYLQENKVTVLNQTPSAFAQFNEVNRQAGSEAKLSLRYIIFAGEALNFHLLKDWYSRRGDTQPQLVNMYGITETTVHNTLRFVTYKDLENSASLIGRSLSDVSLYILDAWCRPTPIGTAGELYVAGDCLARGYLNRPGLTAQRFIPNPFSDQPGARLYKSGDQTRFMPDGDIEFLGRLDTQVKIRGFRIELGEIEARLLKHPEVTAAAVKYWPDADPFLAAYIVARTPLSPADLRTFLKASLPEYMIPARYSLLDTLPKTSNDKLDRKKLPKPVDKAQGADTFIPPETSTEKTLAEIWSRLLNLERVGRNDDFFDIGGHSVMAIRCISHMRDTFEIEVTVNVLFQYPLLSDLAQYLDLTLWNQQETPDEDADLEEEVI